MELEVLHRNIKENAAWISAVEKHQAKIMKEIEKQRTHIKTIKNYVAEQDGFIFDYAPHDKKHVHNKYKRSKNKLENPMLDDVYGKNVSRRGNVNHIYNSYGPPPEVQKWGEYYKRIGNTMN